MLLLILSASNCSADDSIAQNYLSSPFGIRLREYVSQSSKEDILGTLKMTWESQDTPPHWQKAFPFLKDMPIESAGVHYQAAGKLRFDLDFPNGSLSLLSNAHERSEIFWKSRGNQKHVPTDHAPDFDGTVDTVSYLPKGELPPFTNTYWPLNLHLVDELWSTGMLSVDFSVQNSELGLFEVRLNSALKPLYVIKDDGEYLQVQSITSNGIAGLIKPYRMDYDNALIQGQYFPVSAVSTYETATGTDKLTQTFEYGAWGGRGHLKDTSTPQQGSLVFEPSAQKVSVLGGGPLIQRRSNNDQSHPKTEDDLTVVPIVPKRSVWRNPYLLSTVAILIVGSIFIWNWKLKKR